MLILDYSYFSPRISISGAKTSSILLIQGESVASSRLSWTHQSYRENVRFMNSEQLILVEAFHMIHATSDNDKAIIIYIYCRLERGTYFHVPIDLFEDVSDLGTARDKIEYSVRATQSHNLTTIQKGRARNDSHLKCHTKLEPCKLIRKRVFFEIQKSSAHKEMRSRVPQQFRDFGVSTKSESNRLWRMEK